ncbi:MAG TPA: hypothetical protein VMS56_00645 [Thermoanaerobaculia bacterium]|nr:hypothetical protein [Thermoanaerobaculia bacterium]
MKTVTMSRKAMMQIAMIASLVLGCEGAANRPAPVELVATVAQELNVFDLADTECGVIGFVELRNVVKQPDITADARFLDIIVKTYRVSYRRTDGGTLVPAPITQNLSLLVPTGGEATSIGSFQAFEPAALSLAPFAALRPQNGGIDPETGRRTIGMDLILEFFGETLSGEDVYARADVGLTFCIGCGGCR